MLLRKWFAIACAIVLVWVGSGFGQQAGRRGNQNHPGQRRGGLPSVSDLVSQLDKNRDGKLTKDEVTQPPFSRNFSRWDADKDGTVTEAEIAKFRRGLGIPVEGTAGAPNRPQPREAVAELTIPDVDDLLRVGPGTRASRQAMQNSAFVMKTGPHTVDGDKYVILTDHAEQSYLQSIERLAKYRDGLVLRVDDLALLYKHADAMAKIRKQLQDAKVRFLAIAPRMETYRENMLLGMWELISTIDSDPQLDAFPGLLLASNAEDFAGLIDRSIGYAPQSSQEFRPFAISQVPSTRELRSLQKSGILRKLFAEQGCKTPTVAIYSSRAAEAPKLPGDQFWSYQSKSRGDFLKQFPDDAARTFEKASLLVMHGHGVPGMSCGVDIAAIPEELSAKVVLCGSCFAAAPKKSDFPAMRQAPGGYDVEARDAFAVRAIDNGACIAFGHMRLSQGFPHLYPVLEAWMKGKTVGEAYQELMNGIINMQGTKSGGFVVSEGASTGRQPPQNILLYVVIGDPAIQPLESRL
ncbi:MAG: hypothetical protein H8E44_28935 [Planctomycetes bacterium]|nr:hypothetical protein [Planctomycetota bacterium]MBL7043915.1 hypothetical protein [Pirellulaceae bacterium]